MIGLRIPSDVLFDRHLRRFKAVPKLVFSFSSAWFCIERREPLGLARKPLLPVSNCTPAPPGIARDLRVWHGHPIRFAQGKLGRAPRSRRRAPWRAPTSAASQLTKPAFSRLCRGRRSKKAAPIQAGVEKESADAHEMLVRPSSSRQ
jgi:hypothetical protein